MTGSMLSNDFWKHVRDSMWVHYKPIFEAIRLELTAETTRREGRTVEQWILAERECVLREVNRQRERLHLVPVDLADVERIERTAVGHTDYVSKYAHAAADLVLRKEPAWWASR
jgi:hypothetical protein